MQYWIWLVKKAHRNKDYDTYIFEESFLPGLRIPERVESLLTVKWVEENYPHWCRECGMDDHPHPIRPDGSKFCTILFHDAVKPKWKLEDVV